MRCILCIGKGRSSNKASSGRCRYLSSFLFPTTTTNTTNNTTTTTDNSKNRNKGITCTQNQNYHHRHHYQKQQIRNFQQSTSNTLVTNKIQDQQRTEFLVLSRHDSHKNRNRRTMSSSSSRSSNNNNDIDIKIVEVGPRDGLQNEKGKEVSVENKLKLIQLLYTAGCTNIEIGSFVSKKWIPQMANSEDVILKLGQWMENQKTDYQFSCLIPNKMGFDKVLNVNEKFNNNNIINEISIFASASELFSKKNINCTTEESIERFQCIMDCLHDHNNNQTNSNAGSLKIRGYVSCVMGCPYGESISPKQVAAVVEKLLLLGCDEISLGDTIGVGTPTKTTKLLDEIKTIGNFKSSPTVTTNSDSVSSSQEAQPTLAVHFHDTYGQALSNIYVAIDKFSDVVTTIDSSIAGLGGCPYAAGASGNVATEDVIYMLNGMGLKTGIELNTLIDATEFIANDVFVGREIQSKVGRALLAKRKQN